MRYVAPGPDRPRPASRLAAASLGGLTLLLSIGCTHWATQDLSIDRLLETKHPTRVRVTRADGQRTVLSAPRIVGESLVGMTEAHGSRSTAAVALADIRSLEVRRVNAATTVALVAGAGVTAAVIAVAASGPGEKPATPPPSTPPPMISCPLVYSWDGARWRLDSGTFGGAIVRALQRTDVDNLDFAAARDGVVRLDLRNELSETDYVDRLALLAVDHDSAVRVAPDPEGNLRTLGPLIEPARAADDAGRDVLARVARTDGWSWESAPRARDPADAADLRDGITVVFPRPAGATASLVVDARNTPWAAYLLAEFVRAHGAGTAAWYDSLDAHPDEARRLGLGLAREAFLRAELETPSGWRPVGLFWEAGPEVVKRQVLALDLTMVAGDSVRVRLDAPPSFWLIDRVALAPDAGRPLAVRELELASARDRRGRDVRPAIAAVDGSYLALESGDGAELRFRDPDPVSPGTRRTYLLRSTGWYRLRTPSAGPGDPALLARLATEVQGVSRASVERMNRALAAMTDGTW